MSLFGRIIKKSWNLRFPPTINRRKVERWGSSKPHPYSVRQDYEARIKIDKRKTKDKKKKRRSDPFYDRGITFPFFFSEKRGSLDPNSSE